MTHTDNHTDTPMYPALSLMEKTLPPARYGRPPFWRPPITPASSKVHCPTWNWHSVNPLVDGEQAVTLDVNGAYLSAAGSVDLAFGDLQQTGPIRHDTPRAVRPGYYRITTPHWAFSGTIVSPLGDSTRAQSDLMWIAHPTLVLLLELEEGGFLPGVDVVDSFTCDTATSFREWVKRLKTVRNARLDARDNARTTQEHDRASAEYDAFKEGYSAALSMMLTGEICKTRRPDWTHAVHAQHAASSWRKAWRYTEGGRRLVRMGSTDEITVIGSELSGALALPKPPFRYDDSGRQLGAFKIKENAEPTPPADTRPAVLTRDETDDIL